MNRLHIFLAAAIMFCVLGAAERAFAQRSAPSPASRPTFSPWLNLGRDDPGVVGPYYSYVRPQQRLQRTLAQQQASILRQQGDLSAIRGQIGQFQQTGTWRPTGVVGSFMNYSHYYPGFGGGAGSPRFGR